jgi:hypothetical protein
MNKKVKCTVHTKNGDGVNKKLHQLSESDEKDIFDNLSDSDDEDSNTQKEKRITIN